MRCLLAFLVLLVSACAEDHAPGHATFCVMPDGRNEFVKAAGARWNEKLERRAFFVHPDCPEGALDVHLSVFSTSIPGYDGFWSVSAEEEISVQISAGIATGNDPRDLKAVIEHELGHVGCDCADHSDDSRSVMWPQVVGQLGSGEILQSDVDRVNSAMLSWQKREPK